MSGLRHIATALIDALPEESLSGLVRRLAPYVGLAPQLMTRKTAARYLDMSESSLGRLEAMVPRFRDKTGAEPKSELARDEVRLDHTQDLARRVKIHGTAKRSDGNLSRFYGGERVEDSALRDYLLHLNPSPKPSSHQRRGIGGELPNWFKNLLKTDREIHQLWIGTSPDISPRGPEREAGGSLGLAEVRIGSESSLDGTNGPRVAR